MRAGKEYIVYIEGEWSFATDRDVYKFAEQKAGNYIVVVATFSG
jgi:hypothetical protein